jgi:hypothetical protein
MIESFPQTILGSPNTKSMLNLSHNLYGIGKGVKD